MKKLITILLLLTYGICSGQNIVNNPSFEIYSSCPTNINSGAPDQVAKATGWYSSLGTPDYFNSCATQSTNVSIPNNQFGYQGAFTGNGYCGFHCYGGGSNYREIISSLLPSTLIIGQEYFVSFEISFGDKSPYFGIANNKLGIKFSTVAYTNLSPPPINNFAHFYTSAIVSDTLNWIKIKGSFISDSLYQYINLGNFFDDTHTDTLLIGTSGNNYYFIDDICVSIDSNSCYSSSHESVQELNQNNITIYPNPITDKLTVNIDNNEPTEITLYDLSSRKLLQQTFTNTTTINTEQLAKGMYFYEVRCFEKLSRTNRIIKNGKVIKE